MQFNRQRAQLLDYEERYKGIDITRMHEEIESLKTKSYGHQVKEKLLQANLFKIRDQMLQIHDKYVQSKKQEIE